MSSLSRVSMIARCLDRRTGCTVALLRQFIYFPTPDWLRWSLRFSKNARRSYRERERAFLPVVSIVVTTGPINVTIAPKDISEKSGKSVCHYSFIVGSRSLPVELKGNGNNE